MDELEKSNTIINNPKTTVPKNFTNCVIVSCEVFNCILRIRSKVLLITLNSEYELTIKITKLKILKPTLGIISLSKKLIIAFAELGMKFSITSSLSLSRRFRNGKSGAINTRKFIKGTKPRIVI